MNYKEVIESRYNRQNWQLLLHDIFGSKIKFWNHPSSVQTSSPFAKQAFWLGTITLSDEQTIAIYEVELADSVDIERNRRGIRDMLLTAWRNNGNAGAFMFCYRKNESVLRFSYVSESWKFADDGSYQKESTDTRRFTYLLGEGHRSRTAIQQFEQLRDSGLSLKDLTKAFSVDAVSDMFFDGYKKQYENIIFYITGKRMVKVANKWEERLEGQPCETIMRQFACAVGSDLQSPTTEKAVRDYVKKLMGRLVFLQFLQKKGWLGVGIHDEWGSGDPEFIQNLFKDCPDKDHFVNKVLNLLFNDLNTERKDDLSKLSTLNSQLIKIPYLNGGLFEREAADEMEFPLPAKYMQSLLDFFASYNFTIDENDPDDAEVGVDPEMLGRIFENLLEDNKDKGAFYTPKEIVGYMCRESLIAYLQTGVEDETTKEAIRQFVTTHQVQEHLPENTDQLLKDVKICDPAIGSGAFPMGLLKELFLCRTALEGISQHQAAEIKKHIIQQNVYGVDIERGAVDIARLRFWLSLIVDEETPQALPNLDFKIMQGNSLLEQYKGVDLSTMTEKKADDTGMLTFFDDMIDVYRKELRDMLSQYFDCTDHKEKQSLRIRIIENVKQQLREQHINVDFGDLDLSGNDQFFLWHTWFHDVFSKGGFDIVIGNPPYVSVRTKNFDVSKKPVYKNNYTLAVGQYDLYTLFIEHSKRILACNGALAFIIPTRMLSNENFMAAREFVVKYIPIISYVNAQKPFENVDVEANIMICVKGSKPSKVDSVIFNTNTKSFDFLSSISYDSIGLMPFSIFPFVFESNKIKVFEKIQEKSSQRLEVFLNITRGFECGYNDKAIGYGSYKLLKAEFIYPYVLNCEDNIMCSPDFNNVSKYKSKDVFLNTPKLLTKFCSNVITFAIDEVGYCNTNSVYNCHLKVFSDIKFLLAILNSKITTFWFNTAFLNIDTIFPHIQKNQLESIPIPIVTEKKKKDLSLVVDKILAAKRVNSSADTTALENEIDRLVYHLYGLTYDEVLIIDPTPPFTREEYERGARK